MNNPPPTTIIPPILPASDEPLISAQQTLAEITWRGVCIGIILTIILAAANAYLGLKVGNTISASIPAAVIAIGILRCFKDSNVLENTMIQTMASVGEALTAGLAFILPALLILHIWNQFNYWQTVCIGLLGGWLGVLFTIPLRTALLHDRTLRYPEGIAIGNVLKTSAQRTVNSLRAMIMGSGIGAVITFCQTGLQIFADQFQWWSIAGNKMVFGFGAGLSPAMIAAGYIIGINVTLSLLIGLSIGWLLGVPLLTLTHALPSTGSGPIPATEIAHLIWQTHSRYIGIGTMLVGSLWTLGTLLRQVVTSIISSFYKMFTLHHAGTIARLRTERDIPFQYVCMAIFLLAAAIFGMLWHMMPVNHSTHSGLPQLLTAAFSTGYILLGGFIFCAIAAYFAGLIGSTNSPVAGLLICVLLIFTLLYLAFFSPAISPSHHGQLLSILVTISVAAIISAALAISNDTMQDLKVGAIVGATPWKQQCMLIVGVIVTALIIPYILQLLYVAYGIGGIFPRPDMDKTAMLAAPQASLIATVTMAAFNHTLPWNMMLIGMGIALICIVLDEGLKSRGARLPVLAVGLGIYLPLDSSVPCVIGGILSYYVQRRVTTPRSLTTSSATTVTHQQDKGLLLSCGMVTGASLMGILLAIHLLSNKTLMLYVLCRSNTQI